MEVLSVMCNSMLKQWGVELFKGERIPISRDSEGRCILNFRDQRSTLAIPEKELYSCGFIIEDKTDK